VTPEADSGGVSREAALDKLERAGKKLRLAMHLLEEAAGKKPAKDGDKRREEVEMLGEEVRDVYVRVRAAQDALEASPAAGGS
jgi:hypothetical protein